MPALIGYKEAVPMVLMGKEVRPDKAKKMGLVDVVVDPFALESVAVLVLYRTPPLIHLLSSRHGDVSSTMPFDFLGSFCLAAWSFDY